MGSAADLFAPVCSIAPTRRRRFLWAAWWSGPPVPDPFRKPDASSGGARSREEALREAERVAGQRLVETDARWARAWARILVGETPWATRGRASHGSSASPSREAEGASIWSILGVDPKASLVEIKRAFRKRALETHPDHGGDPEVFRRVKRAYEQALARRAKPGKIRR